MQYSGTIIFKPISAKITHDTDWFTKMSPYIVFILGTNRAKSRVSKGGGKTPSWTDTLTLRRTAEDVMYFELWDDETFGKNELIAVGEFPVSKLITSYGLHINEWSNLYYNKKAAGHINIDLTFQPDNPALFNQQQGFGMQQQPLGFGMQQQPGLGMQQTGFGMQQQTTGFGMQQQTTGFGMQQQPTGFGMQQPGFGMQQPGMQQTGFGMQQPGMQQTGFGMQQPGMQQTGFGMQQTGYGMQQTGYGMQQTGYGMQQTGFGMQQQPPSTSITVQQGQSTPSQTTVTLQQPGMQPTIQQPVMQTTIQQPVMQPTIQQPIIQPVITPTIQQSPMQTTIIQQPGQTTIVQPSMMQQQQYGYGMGGMQTVPMNISGTGVATIPMQGTTTMNLGMGYPVQTMPNEVIIIEDHKRHHHHHHHNYGGW